MKKIDKLRVENTEGKLIWKVDTEWLEFDSELNVSSGCAAVCIVDGVITEILEAGTHIVKRKSCKGRQFVIYGVSKLAQWISPWGVGGIPFRDDEFNATTKVGVNGEMNFSVFTPQKLLTALGMKDITPADIVTFVRSEITTRAVAELSALLQGNTYHTINKTISDYSVKLGVYAKEVCARIGILLNSFIVKQIYFPDDYLEVVTSRLNKKQEAEDNLNERFMKRESERLGRKMGESEDDFKEKVTEIIADIAATKKAEIKGEYCPNCGIRLRGGETFCGNCGTKIC